ncbi:hypothetical protein B296_00043066 [Ensete ventricosum]|uniref:Uncharacterized protein n=1 Tax=Ensete ventricosum TaxID=4639 RepID=A0A426X3N9_ENSVE|nr:hypothetical protein B296_00043066 [Ensete ventricosum]
MRWFLRRLHYQRLAFWREHYPCHDWGSRQGLRARWLGELQYVEDDCLEHSCYGLNLVSEPLESLRGHRRAPKAVVEKFVRELQEALDADIQDRIMKEREMQSYIQEREREVAEREAAWKAELSRREVFLFFRRFPSL